MRLKSGLGAMILALAGFAPAQAAIVPSLNGGSPTSLGGGLFQYTYTASIKDDQTMLAGDFLTLYDITGFQGQVTVNGILGGGPDFSVTTPMLGVDPVGPPTIVSPDSSALTNLTITRTSSTPIDPNGTFTFSFVSTQGVVAINALFFAADGTLVRGTTPQANGSRVDGPAAIPEPSVTMMLGVAGMLGLGLRTVRRKRASA